MAKKAAVSTALFHVTSVEASKSALKEGLKGGTKPRNRGASVRRRSIFALINDDRPLTDHVASQQIWPFQNIGSYAVLKIDPKGITGRVVADEVGERSAPWHRIIEQALIDPKYLSLVRVRRFNYPGEAILQIQEAMFQRKLTATEWPIFLRWFDPSLIELHKNLMKGRLPKGWKPVKSKK